MQRFVKMLHLSDNADDIAAYRDAHDHIWPEIVAGIKQVGITAMDIYLLDNHAVMIMELPDEVNVEAAMTRLAALPLQTEWEEYVARFQQCNPGATSAEKWKPMECVFTL